MLCDVGMRGDGPDRPGFSGLESGGRNGLRASAVSPTTRWACIVISDPSVQKHVGGYHVGLRDRGEEITDAACKPAYGSASVERMTAARARFRAELSFYRA
jgi:hypothetical protein